MEVSSEIKEDIRKTQALLRNAIRTHQLWVSRLNEDENNTNIKLKVEEAEQDIVAIGQSQKRVVDRLRRELELYQQRLKARNKQINTESDNHYIALQLRDHQLQYFRSHRSASLLKPSVLSEIHIRAENINGDAKANYTNDNEYEGKSYEKENSSNGDDRGRFNKGQLCGDIGDRRCNFVNALNRAKEAFTGGRKPLQDWPQGSKQEQAQLGDIQDVPQEEHDNFDLSPSPSPPPMPRDGEEITQEIFLRLVGLVTPYQKEVMVKKRDERRKRAKTSTNQKDFLYDNFEANAKRKKLNQFPYLQPHNDPPQTRSAKLRKQQTEKKAVKKSPAREVSPSPSGSSEGSGDDPIPQDCEIDADDRPAWESAPPDTLTVETVCSTAKRECNACGRDDVPSLLVRCPCCDVHLHTSCGADGRCSNCQAALPDPSASPPHNLALYKDKLEERSRLQERNIQLCKELRKLEARAAALKENLEDHQEEKRQLLSDQINTQRNLQKLLDFIGHFKETSLGIHSPSLSEESSDLSKNNED